MDLKTNPVFPKNEYTMMDSHDTNQPLETRGIRRRKKAVEVSEEITETPAEETIVEKPTENASKLSSKKRCCSS